MTTNPHAPALPAAPRPITTERRHRRRFVVDSDIPERGTPRPWRPTTDATAAAARSAASA